MTGVKVIKKPKPKAITILIRQRKSKRWSSWVSEKPKLSAGDTRYNKGSIMCKHIFSSRFMVHFFHGELREGKRQSHASGYHHESGTLATRKIYEGNKSKPDRNGVYYARVRYREGELKCSKHKTFFPQEWSRVQCLAAIREVYEQKPEDNHTWGWQGRSSSGIYIYLQLDKEGKIISAYPKKERRYKPSELRKIQSRRRRKQRHRRLKKLYFRYMMINWMRSRNFAVAFVQITREPVQAMLPA